MSEEIPAARLQHRMRPEVARRRIDSFSKRFGMVHLWLAYHAAFPLALTPDLLYRLWANFQRDIHGEPLKIPWVAVADLLLSSLCDEVGHELYEMNLPVRSALLSDLKSDPNFGDQRITELSIFLLTYVQQQLNSPDPDISDFAKVQQWTALAYTKPSKAASKLAEALSKLDWNDKAGQLRIATLIETFVEQLKDFTPLLMYARGITHYVRGDLEDAELQFKKAAGDQETVEVEGVILWVPEQIRKKIEKVQLHKQNLSQYSALKDALQGESLAPFTPHDLRYNLEEHFPALYTYLHHRAQRFLRSLQFNADEVDQVVEHVIEQLVRLGVAGGGDEKPLTPVDSLTNAQFYAFLNRSIEHKAIERLRKRRLLVSSFAELEKEGAEAENDPLNEVIESVWGTQPFPTPEEITLKLASTQELRVLLRHCIEALKKAPHQLQAVLQELEEIGATALLRAVTEDLKETSYAPEASLANSSQHRDHAHKKLRICLQRQSSNLAVIVALRLTEYGEHTGSTNQEVTVDIQTLAQENLSEDEVRIGLKQLIAEGILDWHDGEIVHLTAVQKKRLGRFYKFEEEYKL